MKRLPIVAAALALLTSASPASAGHAWTFNGRWVHIHTRSFGVYQQLPEIKFYADLSRNWWSSNSNAVELWTTTCHGCAQIHEIEAYYGTTGWIGLASIDAGWDGAGHYTHSHLSYNRSYSDLWNAVTCHEQGHALGLHHDTTSGSCMGWNYGGFPVPYPSGHDYAMLEQLYRDWGH